MAMKRMPSSVTRVNRLCVVIVGITVAMICRGSAQADPAKAPIVGLISMGQAGFGSRNNNAGFDAIPGTSLEDIVAKRNAFGGVVINVPWVELEPAKGGGLNTQPVDGVLREIRAYNRDPRTTKRLRAILRIWAAANAPDWVKTLDGAPLKIYTGGPAPRASYTIGRPWSVSYEAAWRSLQDRLAAIYDREPLIVQISNTSCTTDDDEWNALARYHNQQAGISSIRTLREAGFTDALFDACMMNSLQDYASWKTTDINLNLGPVFRTQGVADYGWPRRDASFAIALMQRWRSALGSRVVLSNHNLSDPSDRNVIVIYEAIRGEGGEIEFQTHSPAGLNWPGTIKQAVCLGAHSLEIWNSTNRGGYVDFPASTLIAWSDELEHTKSSKPCMGQP